MKKKVFNWSEVHLSEVTSYIIHILGVNSKSISTHCVPTFILTCIVRTSAFAKSRCNLFYEEIRLERVI